MAFKSLHFFSFRDRDVDASISEFMQPRKLTVKSIVGIEKEVHDIPSGNSRCYT